MPLPLLAAYAAMLPRLQAQESLRAVTETGVGSGAMESQAAKTLLREWMSALEPSARAARRATGVDLAALPIRVRQVPVEKKE